jgi:hypothetical protein
VNIFTWPIRSEKSVLILLNYHDLVTSAFLLSHACQLVTFYMHGHQLASPHLRSAAVARLA